MITIKSEAEIACMRESGRLTGDLLKYLEKQIKPGMTTKALDKLAYEYIRSFGATPCQPLYITPTSTLTICPSLITISSEGIP